MVKQMDNQFVEVIEDVAQGSGKSVRGISPGFLSQKNITIIKRINFKLCFAV